MYQTISLNMVLTDEIPLFSIHGAKGNKASVFNNGHPTLYLEIRLYLYLHQNLVR